MSDRLAAGDIPVFSERLDTVLAAMINGEAPNYGRFCGYCYTPLVKTADICRHCARSVEDIAPVQKVPSEVVALYRRMRKRESIIVNSFAFAGLFLGVVLFTVLVGVAVFMFDASWLMLALATVVLMVGGRVFAGILGGWIGDNIGYDYAQRRLREEWAEFDAQRQRGDAAQSPSLATETATNPR